LLVDGEGSYPASLKREVHMATARRARSPKRTGTRKAGARKTGRSRLYGEAAEKRVASAMRRRKRGTLKSSSGAKVKSRKQAIAIGLSEARAKGGKVPPPKGKARRKR
jgi:hypothetical protein